MELEFPIDRLDIEVQCHGSGIAQIYVNDELFNLTEINGQKLKKDNVIKIKFSKADPKDESSYGEIKRFSINGHSFINDIKTIPYTPDKRYHTAKKLPNNLYLGYIGKMSFTLRQKNDPLSRAGWILANNEFEHVKWPLKHDVYREKSFENLVRDTKYMFTGSLSPNIPDINTEINNMCIGDLRMPLKTDRDRDTIEQWINQSSRIKFDNFSRLPYFTYSNGILDSLNSFVLSSERIYMSEKMYYFHGELLKDKSIQVRNLLTDELVVGSDVLIELPSPWYNTNMLMEKIKEAKNKDCRVALDLTWMPASNDAIHLDLDLVDQIFLSMNKTWPIHDVRPAFRWSKRRINDSQTFQYEFCSYPKVGANVFMKLLEKFPFDYAYDKYKTPAEQIRRTFDLEPTSVLWFTRNDLYTHDPAEHISRHYYLDDFVCIRKLLDFKGKYFW